eukprot:scaffold573_cov414-Prasinococcus_capsulatus_cf.AAC.3
MVDRVLTHTAPKAALPPLLAPLDTLLRVPGPAAAADPCIQHAADCSWQRSERLWKERQPGAMARVQELCSVLASLLRTQTSPQVLARHRQSRVASKGVHPMRWAQRPLRVR